MSIRDYIKSNFKDSSKKEIEESICSSIKEGDEVTLPGLGVLFEILWQNSEENLKDEILSNLDKNL